MKYNIIKSMKNWVSSLRRLDTEPEQKLDQRCSNCRNFVTEEAKGTGWATCRYPIVVQTATGQEEVLQQVFANHGQTCSVFHSKEAK